MRKTTKNTETSKKSKITLSQKITTILTMKPTLSTSSVYLELLKNDKVKVKDISIKSFFSEYPKQINFTSVERICRSVRKNVSRKSAKSISYRVVNK